MGKRKKTGSDQPSTPPAVGTESSQRVNPEAQTGIVSASAITTILPTSPPSIPLATSSAEAGSNVQQMSNSSSTNKAVDSTKTETPPYQQPQSSVLGTIAQVPSEGIKLQSPEQMVKSQQANVSDNSVAKADVSKADKEPQVQEIANQTPHSAVMVKEIQEKLSMPKPVSPQHPPQSEQKVLELNTTLENINKPAAVLPQSPITTKTDTDLNKNISQTPVQLPAQNPGDKKPNPEKPTSSQIPNVKDTKEAPKDSASQKIPPPAPLQSTTTAINPPTANILPPVSDTSKSQNLVDKKELPKTDSGKQSPVPSVKPLERMSSDKSNPAPKISQTNVIAPSSDSQKVTVEKKDPVPQKEKTLENKNGKGGPENTTPVSPQKQVSAEKTNASKGAVDKKKSESPLGEKPSQIPVPLEKITSEKNSTNKLTSQGQVNKESEKSNIPKVPISAEGATVLPSLKDTTENKTSVPVCPISDKKEATTQPPVAKNINDPTKSQNEKPSAFSPAEKQPVVQKTVEVEKPNESSAQQKPAVPDTTQKPKENKATPSNTSESRAPVQQKVGKAPPKPPLEIPAAQSDTKLDSYSEKVNKSNKVSGNNQVSAENKEIEKNKGENKTPAAVPQKNDKSEKKESDQNSVKASSPSKDDKSTPVSAGKGVQPKAPLPQSTDVSKKDGTKVIPAQMQAKKGNKAEEKTASPRSETPKPKAEASTVSSEVLVKKENTGSTKKVNSDKISDTTPKKPDPLSRNTESNVISSNQNASKMKEVTTAQSGNTSKLSNENEPSVGPISETPLGSPQKTQKQPEALGEVKIDDVNNKDKGKAPENKTPPKKSPTTTKTKSEETTPKSGPAASNEQQDGNVSKKAKSKKPKQKGSSDTDTTKPVSTATKENQPISKVECGNKDTSKATVGGKPQENSNLLGLVQEVIEGIGKQGSSSPAPTASTEKGVNDTEPKSTEEMAKKSKRSRNKKKSKAKEGQDSQEKGDSKETLKVQDNQGDTAKTNNEQQKKKPEENRTGDQGKSGTKSKKEKGKKEGTSQSGEKSKQNPPRSKTNQSSATDISNVSLSSSNLKADDGTAATDSKELQGQGDDQPKKKRKRRKNKGKQTANGEDKGIGVGIENIAPTSEATEGIKKKLQ